VFEVKKESQLGFYIIKKFSPGLGPSHFCKLTFPVVEWAQNANRKSTAFEYSELEESVFTLQAPANGCDNDR